jgi:hypothetical protein
MRNLFNAFAAGACLLAAGCTHAANSDANGSPTAQQTMIGLAATPPASTPARPAHPSDGWLLADIAFERLGGVHAANPAHVTGVSIIGGFGIAVYVVGRANQELLCTKQGGTWRPLGTDAFLPDGRGLVHFGLSPQLAARLVAGLKPVPTH